MGCQDDMIHHDVVDPKGTTATLNDARGGGEDIIEPVGRDIRASVTDPGYVGHGGLLSTTISV